jgi:hypothetical protein
MYYDRPGTRTVKPNATGRMPLKNAIEVENGGSTDGRYI